MIPSLGFARGLVSVFSLVVVVGCHFKGSGETSSESVAPSSSVTPTCEDAARRYGEFHAKALAEDPRNPLAPALREKAKKPIADAVVRSCVEDQWSELPLECLAAAFEKELPAGVKMGDALAICAGGAGREKTAKMDERVARAMASVERGTPAAAPALYISKSGGYRVDFKGRTPVESMKNDPNGGRWHDASVKSGRFSQHTDYLSGAVAEAEVRAFLPTRDKRRIRRDEKVRFLGLAGRDIEVAMNSGKVLWIRFLIDGRRVFKLGAVYAKDKTDATAFIQSFERLSEAAPEDSAAIAAQPPARVRRPEATHRRPTATRTASRPAPRKPSLPAGLGDGI